MNTILKIERIAGKLLPSNLRGSFILVIIFLEINVLNYIKDRAKLLAMLFADAIMPLATLAAT